MKHKMLYEFISSEKSSIFVIGLHWSKITSTLSPVPQDLNPDAPSAMPSFELLSFELNCGTKKMSRVLPEALSSIPE